MTRGTGKPFKAGQSGNPRGRKPGTGAVAKLRADIAKHVPDIVARLVELAKAGDAQAARLLLERVLPPIRASEQAVSIKLPADASLTDQGRAVIAAAAAGEIAPNQAAQLLTSLGAMAKLIETDEHEARIAALEGTSHGKP